MSENVILEQIRHRPWPLPDAPWTMFQSWRDVLFLHWPVPYEKLWPLVPHNLTLETHRNSAWLTITALEMADVHMHGLPGVPTATNFPELNVRTYVSVDDMPGVYFFSLDAASTLAVKAARGILGMPYHKAEMAIAHDDDQVVFASRRDEKNAPPAEFVATYRPTGTPNYAKPESLDHFLAERYCLYNVQSDESISRIDIHHGPWLLDEAEVSVQKNTMTDYLGLVDVSDNAPIVHYAARQDTLVWTPTSVQR